MPAFCTTVSRGRAEVWELGPLNSRLSSDSTKSRLSSLIDNEFPSATLTTRHPVMSTQLAVKAQLGLFGISTRCQSCGGTARGAFLVLRQFSSASNPLHTIAPSRPSSVSAGRWRTWRAGKTTFSTSSLRRVPEGENPPAAAGEPQAGGKAGEHDMAYLSLLGRKQWLTDACLLNAHSIP